LSLESDSESGDTASNTTYARPDHTNTIWNFAGGLIHGTFFRVSVAFAEPTTILPVYIMLLTDSKSYVGLLSSILLAGAVLPTLFFSRYVEPRPRKLPFLLVAVFSRAASWLVLGALTWLLGAQHPLVTLAVLFVLLLVFSLGGSLGGVTFTDIIGKVIPAEIRGRFLGTRQLVGSLAALGTGIWVRQFLAREDIAFPTNYATLFFLSAAALTIAGVGFAIMREPAQEQESTKPPLREYLSDILAILRQDATMRRYLLVRNLIGFHIMIVPFYVLFAREVLGVSTAVVGTYVLMQVLGGSASNIVWAQVNDRFGSHWVLRSCIGIGLGLPLLALALGRWAPAYYGVVFLLLGAALNSRELAFTSFILDIAPVERRPTYAGMSGTLTAPTLVFPFLGGLLLDAAGYLPVFTGVSVVMTVTMILALGLHRRYDGESL